MEKEEQKSKQVDALSKYQKNIISVLLKPLIWIDLAAILFIGISDKDLYLNLKHLVTDLWGAIIGLLSFFGFVTSGFLAVRGSYKNIDRLIYQLKFPIILYSILIFFMSFKLLNPDIKQIKFSFIPVINSSLIKDINYIPVDGSITLYSKFDSDKEFVHYDQKLISFKISQFDSEYAISDPFLITSPFSDQYKLVVKLENNFNRFSRGDTTFNISSSNLEKNYKWNIGINHVDVQFNLPFSDSKLTLKDYYDNNIFKKIAPAHKLKRNSLYKLICGKYEYTLTNSNHYNESNFITISDNDSIILPINYYDVKFSISPHASFNLLSPADYKHISFINRSLIRADTTIRLPMRNYTYSLSHPLKNTVVDTFSINHTAATHYQKLSLNDLKTCQVKFVAKRLDGNPVEALVEFEGEDDSKYVFKSDLFFNLNYGKYRNLQITYSEMINGESYKWSYKKDHFDINTARKEHFITLRLN